VSKTKPHLIFSGDAVSFFLFLSGFGLASSIRNNFINFKDFFLKRIRRVMVPYWIVTILILILDYLILGRVLKSNSLILTFFGINTRQELWYLDYVRWFVTFILLWYLVFYILFLRCRTRFASIWLFGLAFVLLPFNYYFWNFGWYNFFSFPIGCLAAINHEKMISFFNKYFRMLVILSVIGLCYVILYKILMSTDNIYIFIINLIPNILFVYIHEVNSLILFASLICLTVNVVNRGFCSQFLQLIGEYSYEIFLLHGIFLIKYNFIINSAYSYVVIFQFFSFLAFIILISFLTKKIYS
jgi:membrane-bound acyltransferase YfiQ involved in biofilm formation